MTDKELLQLAAKAAGLKIGAWHDVIDDYYSGWNGSCGFEFENVYWNPLIDDGDAFRLAIKLGIEIEIFRNIRAYAGPKGTAKYGIDADENTDIYQATRRAIVLAAVEIGKGME